MNEIVSQAAASRPLAARRRLTVGLVAASLAGVVRAAPSPSQAPFIEVWKSAGCGCCQDWIVHLQSSGFQVKVHESGNAEARTRLGIPARLASCHTAQIDGYAIEGHVPAREVQRLLRERPAAIGLTVPGMPIGSPGMDGPAYGGRQDAYGVLLVSRDGSTTVYQSYP